MRHEFVRNSTRIRLRRSRVAHAPRRRRRKRRVSAQDGGSRRVGIWGKSVAGRSRRSGRADGLDGDRVERDDGREHCDGTAAKRRACRCHRLLVTSTTTALTGHGHVRIRGRGSGCRRRGDVHGKCLNRTHRHPSGQSHREHNHEHAAGDFEPHVFILTIRRSTFQGCSQRGIALCRSWQLCDEARSTAPLMIAV